MKLRVGLIGAGANTKARHIPGLRAVDDVEIVAVCNRRAESTAAAARELNIPRTFSTWEEVVADPDIDAVVIGTWPYLHAPITLTALKAGKHVLTEARMCLDSTEAHRMLQGAREHPNLVCQIVPSPFGLTGDTVMRELIGSGYLGELREVSVIHRTAALADPTAPLHWRQDATLSGYNALTLGIFHETLLRWLPQPVRVVARAQTFTPTRIDPASGARRAVGTPDSLQVLAELPATEHGPGAAVCYQFSGVTPYGQEGRIELRGTGGVLSYDLIADRIRGASRVLGTAPGFREELTEVPIPQEKRGGWRVEADFVDSIRQGSPVRFTSFTTGVDYMEFTEAVARSASAGRPVTLPLDQGEEDEVVGNTPLDVC
jgi:predicted dehydrogenase